MKLGSLFDGSGGFPLAGALNGIEPVWASEIEPYPLRVTAARLPKMKRLGDVTKINGAEIEPVDVITFGSPCQDLSVVGKQAGIREGQRSKLFFEAIRIIHEMRVATNGLYPNFAVWENVPGAFSSGHGDDFGCVLQAFVDEIEGQGKRDVPRPEKWLHAGEIRCDCGSVAWRVPDAQYWGVPQRRRRIYLVADFRGQRAGEILFERESLSGHPEQSREAREAAVADAQGGAGRGREAWVKTCGQMNTEIGHNICPTLTDNKDRFPTCYALQGNGIDRADTAGCNGCGWREDQMYTLNTIDRHACVYPTVCGTIDACYYKGQGEREGRERDFVVYDMTHANDVVREYVSVCPTLQHRMGTGGNQIPIKIDDGKPPRKYMVRRLTPLECCRLQGFPDCWEDGVQGSDSARYKMWGNGIALPCAAFVLGGIAEELKGEEND